MQDLIFKLSFWACYQFAVSCTEGKKNLCICEQNICFCKLVYEINGSRKVKNIYKEKQLHLQQFVAEICILCLYPSVLPINIPSIFSIYTDDCKKAIRV